VFVSVVAVDCPMLTPGRRLWILYTNLVPAREVS
jgi:hypothetical protein